MRNYLVKLREKRNESQQDVANALGISRQYYAMIENGSRQKKMGLTLLVKIAELYGLPLDEAVQMEQDYQDQILTANPTERR